ncbi:MAG: hypothetical protein AB1505_35390, partial [Candidatus Latescibacterota bacterium]
MPWQHVRSSLVKYPSRDCRTALTVAGLPPMPRNCARRMAMGTVKWLGAWVNRWAMRRVMAMSVSMARTLPPRPMCLNHPCCRRAAGPSGSCQAASMKQGDGIAGQEMPGQLGVLPSSVGAPGEPLLHGA